MGRSALRRWLPALALALVLLVASLVPLAQNGGAVPVLLGVALDKWAHAVGYGAFTVALASGRRAGTRSAVAVLVAVAIAYGAGIETLQGLLASRSTSVADLLANGVGAVVAGAVWHRSRRSNRD